MSYETVSGLFFCSVSLLFVCFLCFFFFFAIFGPLPRHVEVLRLGVRSELQLLAYATATAMQDPATTETYTTAHGNAGSLTH